VTSEPGYRWSDQDYLRGHQYRTDANLHARQSIYAYQQPRIDLPRAVLDVAGASADEVVVDIGCGNGAYLAELSRRGHPGPVIGVDLSMGMLQAAQRAVPAAKTVVADAGALPLIDGVAALVLVAHMLYHVPDPAAAVTETRRVLDKGGRLVAVLNEDDHLQELRQAVSRARQDVGLADLEFGERLGLRQGTELLSATYPSVVRHDFVGELVLDDLEPLAAYVGTMIDTTFVVEQERRDYVELVLRYMPRGPDGGVRIRTHCGCLVCS
jgi:SAM-dependent methyltransferase